MFPNSRVSESARNACHMNLQFGRILPYILTTLSKYMIYILHVLKVFSNEAKGSVYTTVEKSTDQVITKDITCDWLEIRLLKCDWLIMKSLIEKVTFSTVV